MMLHRPHRPFWGCVFPVVLALIVWYLLYAIVRVVVR